MNAIQAGKGVAGPPLGELGTAALLRRGFRHAQVLMAHSLAEYDLSALSYHLLLEVGAAGDQGVVQGDLADLLQCPDARVSMLVRDLAARGLVRADRSAPDRRVVRIQPTPAGIQLTRKALHRQREVLSSLSEYAGLPGVTDLLRDALRLYLGVDVHLEGVVSRISGLVGDDYQELDPS
ncbi:MAG TPA: MarR family winged helix-turn-helix transcriptional regulator [Candidatus Binatia bacterium]|nr:MarR family winged helix-turn-helix transcriptional regulator [Candidatus Binatia bacterium]